MTRHVSRSVIHIILAATASCVTAAGGELLYVSLPISTNAVVTYDLSLGDATAIRNSQQTFASGTDVAAPQGVAIDQQGNVFVANELANTISKFDSSGTLLTTIGSAASLSEPVGLAVDSAGTLYAANYGSGPAASSVARFDAGGNFVASMTAQINRPWGVTVDTSGHLFVGNWFLNTVSKFDASGTFLATIGSSSTITSAPPARCLISGLEIRANRREWAAFHRRKRQYGGLRADRLIPSDRPKPCSRCLTALPFRTAPLGRVP